MAACECVFRQSAPGEATLHVAASHCKVAATLSTKVFRIRPARTQLGTGTSTSLSPSLSVR